MAVAIHAFRKENDGWAGRYGIEWDALTGSPGNFRRILPF